MDSDKTIALLKLGYFPVTDDFWAAANMPYAIGKGWTWAFRMPLAKQPFMPYSENTLTERSIEESQIKARQHLRMNY